MKKQSRNTVFWGITTPSKVGPGSYELSPNKKFRYNSAPFSKAEIKEISSKLPQSTLPGPGSYNPSTEWVKTHSPSSSFASNLPKGMFHKGNAPQLLSINTPGPGHYNPDGSKPQRPAKKFKQLSMIVEASIASIPYKPGENQQVGPASYNPDLSLIKPKVLTTNFSTSNVKREAFEFKYNSNLGPGKYKIQSPNTFNKQTWVFSSKVSKNNETKPEEIPGPGAYNPKFYTKQPRVLVEGFGSTTERDIAFTNDPHRPYGSVDSSLPGINNESLSSSKMDFFRQKYLNPKTPIPKPPFGTSEKRESEWVNKNSMVGPGEYELKYSSPKPSKFVHQSIRFKSEIKETMPGPGSYEFSSPTKNTGYISKLPRFIDNKIQYLESYITHQPWKVKKHRGDRYGIELSFESTSPRFAESTSDSPGPGQYKIPEKKTSGSVIYSRESRFGLHGNYIPSPVTESDIGPGSYHKESLIGKKTFNISPDIGDDRPWI
jgi:Sperm-tail PG-rich repeat